MLKPIILQIYLAIVLAAVAMTLPSCLSNNEEPELPELMAVMRSESSISQFVQAMDRSGFTDNMLSNVGYTILAPNNDAFSTYLSASGYGSIDSIPLTYLNNLVTYHVQFGYAPAENIVTNYYASPSLGGYEGRQLVLFVEQTATGLFFNGNTGVVRTNIKADNGIVHIIDKVLALPGVNDMLEQNSEFSMVFDALEKTSLDALLENASPYTLLAPTNQAFENYISASEYATFDDIPKDTLARLMRFHLLAGNFSADSLSGLTINTLLSGKSLEFTPQISGSLAVGDQAEVLLSDIQCTNGIIHAINRVMAP